MKESAIHASGAFAKPLVLTQLLKTMNSQPYL